MQSPEGKIRIPNKVILPIAAVFVAYLVQQAAAGEQQRQVKPNMSSVGRWLDKDVRDASQVLPTETLVADFDKQLKDLTDSYNVQFQAENKELRPLITEPVRIRINHPDGVYVRSLPDEKLGQIKKVLNPDSDQRVHNRFVLKTDKTTGQVEVWVAQSEGEKPEFFAIYFQGQALVEITGELNDIVGQPLSVKALVGRFAPESFSSEQQSK